MKSHLKQRWHYCLSPHWTRSLYVPLSVLTKKFGYSTCFLTPNWLTIHIPPPTYFNSLLSLFSGAYHPYLVFFPFGLDLRLVFQISIIMLSHVESVKSCYWIRIFKWSCIYFISNIYMKHRTSPQKLFFLFQLKFFFKHVPLVGLPSSHPILKLDKAAKFCYFNGLHITITSFSEMLSSFSYFLPVLKSQADH